jgi:hypothetical protein
MKKILPSFFGCLGPRFKARGDGEQALTQALTGDEIYPEIL